MERCAWAWAVCFLSACAPSEPSAAGRSEPLYWATAAHAISTDWIAGEGFGESPRGTAVAIDGTTLVVGVPGRDEGATDSGAVYVFTAAGTSWTQQQKIRPSGLAASARFGSAVDVSGDTLVVGSPGASEAFVYVRSGTTWTLQQELVPSETIDASDSFGVDVAIDGDTIAASNDRNDDGGTNAGVVYVFTRTGATWTEQAELRGSRVGPGSASGSYLDVSGDTIAVWSGVLPDISSGIVHLVYVFVRSGTTWSQQRELAGPPDTSFGTPLALDGDTMALPTGGSAANVRVYVRSGSTWSVQQTLSMTPAGGLDLLGDRLVVGHVNAARTTGSVRIIERAGTMWSTAQTLTGDGQLGPAVALGASWIGANLTPCSVFRCPPDEDAVRLYTLVSEKANGESCADPIECTSGFCVDGVCCNAACGAGATDDCEACSAAAGAAVDGTCGALSASAGGAIVCRTAAGPCDVAETCVPTARACPPDGLASSGTACRAAADACDVAETCSGTSATCPADALRSCSDANACTADSCAPPGGCAHAPIAGCCNADADCADADVCTLDRCPVAGGACTHAPIAGCCASALDCDDGNPCTGDRCDAATSTCARDAVPGCCGSDADCDDSDACTTDSCATASGTCSNSRRADCCVTAGDCDDGVVCTEDRCLVAGGTCARDVIAGCCETDGDCDDSSVCTTDGCNGLTNRCESAPVDGCCAADADCDDDDPCTTDGCESNACTHAPIASCEPGDAGSLDGGSLRPDGGAGPDAGLDAAIARDGGTSGDAGSPPPAAAGCCRIAAASRSGPGEAGLWMALSCLALARVRRRSRSDA